MVAYRRKRYTKKTIKKSRRRTKRTSTASVKRIVKQAISRSLENKCRQYNNTFNVVPSSDIGAFDANILPLHPYQSFLQIDQGVGQGARIGNSITTKRVMFKGTLTPKAYNPDFNPTPSPHQIKMFIFYDRRFPTFQPTPATNGDFYQFNNTSEGFSNNLTDLWKPVNTDRYRLLYQRTFKLGFAAYSGTGSSASFQSYANNDFKLNANFSINITKYLIKTVKFDDNNSDPTTRGLWCMFVPLKANGDPIPSANRLSELSCMIDYNYEDA